MPHKRSRSVERPDIEYFSFELTGHKSSKASGKHQYDAGGAADLFAHDDRLFDQDESGSGEQYDASTGERIDNSTYNGMEDLHEVQSKGASYDAMGEMPKEKDEAAKWLADHEFEVELIDETRSHAA